MSRCNRFAAAGAAAAVAIALGQGAAQAGGVTGADLEEVTVRANRLALGGAPRAASEGTVLGEQLENRPLLRVGERRRQWRRLGPFWPCRQQTVL